MYTYIVYGDEPDDALPRVQSIVSFIIYSAARLN